MEILNTKKNDNRIRVDGNGGGSPNYYPNSFDKIEIDDDYKELPIEL